MPQVLFRPVLRNPHKYMGADREAEMKRNFKIGDEVLVRMKIINKQGQSKYIGTAPSNDGLENYFSEEDIFAHAPEYNIGDELEFSHDGEEWNKEKLTGLDWDESRAQKFMGEGFFYEYARRPQPKPEDEDEKTLTLDGKKYKLVLVEE